MADQLKDTKDSHDPDQPHDLSSLAKDLEILQTLHQGGNEVRKNGQEVNLRSKRDISKSRRHDAL